MTDKPDLTFDAATALNTLVAELIVELVKADALTRTQAAKILLRAESIIDALHFQKDRDEPLLHHQMRLELLRRAHAEVLERVQKRLGLQPDVGVLRYRRRRVAEAYRRRKRGI